MQDLLDLCPVGGQKSCSLSRFDIFKKMMDQPEILVSKFILILQISQMD